MKSTNLYKILVLLFLVGCTSKIVFDEVPPVVIIPSADIIISEVSTAINTDAGKRNHYVELYNGGSIAVDLSNYAVGYFATTDTSTISNFDFSTAGSYINLNKILDTGKCYVIASPQCDAIKVKSDTTWGTTSTTAANASVPLQLSGNSAVALLKKDTAGSYNLGGFPYKIVDVFGSPMVARTKSQGATSTRNNIMWAIAGEIKDTRNRTFFRKSIIKKPTANWDSARGIDATTSQWILSGDKAWDYTNVGLPTQ